MIQKFGRVCKIQAEIEPRAPGHEGPARTGFGDQLVTRAKGVGELSGAGDAGALAGML